MESDSMLTYPIDSDGATIDSNEIHRFFRSFRAVTGEDPLESDQETLRNFFENHYSIKAESSKFSIAFESVKSWIIRERGYDPSLDTSTPDSDKEQLRILTESELDRLFGYTRNHIFGVMIRLIYGAGLKLGEVIMIRNCDILLDENRIQLRSEPADYKGESDAYLRAEKIHKTILPDSLRFELVRESSGRDPEAPLFMYNNLGEETLRPVNKRSLQYYLNRSIDELGMERITPQCLRDNFAIQQLRKGIDPRILKDLMGFKNVRSLARYQNVVDPDDVKIDSPLDFHIENHHL